MWYVGMTAEPGVAPVLAASSAVLLAMYIHERRQRVALEQQLQTERKSYQATLAQLQSTPPMPVSPVGGAEAAVGVALTQLQRDHQRLEQEVELLRAKVQEP